MANYLAQAGHTVEVYEKRPDLRQADISAGRSINLALSVRGIHALKEIGVIDEVMEMLSKEGVLMLSPCATTFAR